MSSSSPLPRRESEGHGTEVKLRIAAAARDLFAAQGYENTTVEAIAERAGVARRTFFRHFRSKDDAIFPDHTRIAALTEAHLAALQDVPPLVGLASGVRMVFRSYVDDPVVSVERYRLTRSFPALRDREIASVSRYTRLFGSYLRGRFGDAPGAALHAEAVAAVYVAAHNHVLRQWLRSAGEGDPMPALDEAFVWVAARFASDLPGASGPGPTDGSAAGRFGGGRGGGQARGHGAADPRPGSGPSGHRRTGPVTGLGGFGGSAASDGDGVPRDPGAAGGARAPGGEGAPDGAGASDAVGGSGGPGGGGGPAGTFGDGDDVVVAVFRSGEQIDDVVERIYRSL